MAGASLEVYITNTARVEPIATVNIGRKGMRHRTGLHNRWRNGKGSYCKKKKARTKDTYGALNGRRISDIIGGRVVTYEVQANGQA